MAATLEEEIKRRKAADALLSSADDGGDDSVDTSMADEEIKAEDTAEADTKKETEPKESDKPEEPAQSSALDWQSWPVFRDQPKTIEPLTAESVTAKPTISPPEPKPRPIEPLTAESVNAPAPDTLTQVERGELVKLPAEAPDQLTQVERGELVKPPAEAPDQLTQVERGELVKPPAEAPDTLTQVERGELVKVPPGTAPRAVAIPAPPAVRTAEPAAPSVPFMGEEGVPIYPTPPKVLPAQPAVAGAPETKAAAPVTKAAAPVTQFQNPNGSDLPSRVQAVGDQDPVAFIVHHTSGRGTVDGVISTLKERGLGVQFVEDRDGNIFQTGGPGAQNILKGWGKGEGLNNQNVVGMEIIAKDDADVLPVQKQAFARFIAARYPTTQLLGHGEVNPGHKEADEGKSAKEAALAYRDQVASGTQAGTQVQAPVLDWRNWPTSGAAVTAAATTGDVQKAQPVDTSGKVIIGTQKGFYPDEDPAKWAQGTVTTFGGSDDVAKYRAARAAGLTDKEASQIGDSGVGSPRLGQLNTNNNVLHGIAIPVEVADRLFGKNYGAMRQARADVVDLNTGQRMRVPLVDLGGKGGVVADMTTATFNAFGGDTGHKFAVNIVPNAGSDVTKNPQDFWNEQAAIRAYGDISVAARAGAQQPVTSPKSWMAWPTLPAAEQVSAQIAQQYKVQSQQERLTQLASDTNLGALYKRLDQPVEGVSTPLAKQFQQNLKPQIIQAIREKFPEIKTDDEAWTKAMSDPGILDVSREWAAKALGFAQQFGLVMKQGAAGMDQNYVDKFLAYAMPNASDADKHAYLTKLYAMPPAQRNAEISSKLPSPLEGIATGTPRNTLLPYAEQVTTALQHLADPEFQKHKADEIAQYKAQMERNISDDPRLKGTVMERVVDATAQLPSVIAAYSNPVLWPIALAQVADQAREGFRSEHPEWDSKTLEETTARATFVQFFGQQAANLVMAKGLGALMSTISSPVKRAIATALGGMLTQPGIAAVTQVGTNVATGQPISKGVGEAAITGAIQGVIPGVVHGVGEFTRPVPETGPRGAPIRGAEERTLEETQPPEPSLVRPIVTSDILGSEAQARSAALAQAPWYQPGPIVTRAEQPEAFSPAGLAEATRAMRQVGTPEQMRQAAENLQPADFRQREVFLGSQTQEEIDRAIAAQAAPVVPVTQEDVARRAYELHDERTKTGQPGTALDDWAQAREELKATAASGEPILPASMGDSEPITSAIANRYRDQRIAQGELGPVEAAQGQSTEEQVIKGLKMSPKQRETLINDMMAGKGGNLDLQMSALRAKELYLSEASKAASRDAMADPTNAAKQQAAQGALAAITDFHNGPLKEGKRIWSDSGRALQQEIPVDYTTLNGLKEAYLKFQGKSAPNTLDPVLSGIAKKAQEAANNERVSANGLADEIGKYIAGSKLSTDDQVRAELAAIMKNLPCPT